MVTNDFSASASPALDFVTGPALASIAGAASDFITSFAPGSVAGPVLDFVIGLAPGIMTGRDALVVIDFIKGDYFYRK